MSAARYLAGFAASAFLVPALCAAAQVKVNDEAPLDLQSPPGFTYVNQGGVATLSVATAGFMMCANIVPSGGQPLTNVGMAPQHGQWRFPTAVDLRSVGYGSGTLAIGRNASGVIDSYLVCHTAGAEGEVLTPRSDGVMRSGFDSKMVEQFTSMVNWLPGQGFTWSNPDWTQVPTDPCSPSADQPAAVTEDIACTSVVGSKPAGVGGTERAPTIWTASDASNFYYIVRFDARWGQQNLIDGTGPVLPDGNTDRAPAGSSAEIKLTEAYNRGVVGVGGGYLGDTGQWCLLADLPATLNGNMCAGAANGGVLNGPFVSASPDSGIVIGLPPAQPRLSFYMGFIRPIVGAAPPIDEPVVAVSVLLDPAVSGEGGDRFRGDDVAFGFLPNSQGFPWMHGGQ